MATVRAQEEASSSTFRYNYQVFLSFRGEDTRKTFTDHLYTALFEAGLRTFRDDDEIERGKRLELELRKAIQQSRISIIVLSKNYASSKWCLDEVVMILEWSRSNRSGHEVLPVFYDVDPSDVRNQKGSIGEAFARYKEELIDAKIDDVTKKEWMEKLQGWKVALREVANLTGMVLQNQANGHEAKFIQEIVEVVELKLNRPVLHVSHHLVGMDSRAKNIDLWVQDSSSSQYILVICGMGGIGKTTIAKYVYNLNFQRFEGHAFLASVKEKSQQPNGLVNLQRQLLSSILKGKRKEIYDIDEGIIKISDALLCKRILLVIDDVDEVEQLDALLGTREFHLGSKIIITTRNKSLLNTYEVHKLHTIQELSFYESLELFCWHAFGKEHPAEGYKEQSERAVYHCRGLPLAHKILGSSLAGKSTEVWASTLDKLKAIPETKILNVLKISFESLQGDHDKSIFLHIACFFVGHDKDETIEILDACDFFTTCGIQNLVDRCLISIDYDNKLMMHQFLQEMGWQIIDQESPREPGRRSRLWRAKESFEVLKGRRGTETIEGLVLDMRMCKDNAFTITNGENSVYDEFYDTFFPFKRRYFNFLSSEPSSDIGFNYDTFSRMDKLCILKLNHTKLSGCCENFPKGLRWLCLHGFPLKCLPFGLPLRNLVSLDMSYSKLEHVWAGDEKVQVLLSLKILNLSHSQGLMKTPNFRGLPNLEKLILKGCISLVEVCDTVGNLKRLAFLDLENCKSLMKFPNVHMLESLQTLILNGCSNIISESLNVVHVNGVAVNPLPTKLWHILFQAWVSKPILNDPQHTCVSLPRSLVSLSLQNCNLSDDDFPLDFSNLSMLKQLDLSNNLFLNLPRCIGSLRNLWKLNLSSCKELHYISGLPNVAHLIVNECRSLESVTFQSALTRRLIFTPSFSIRKLREIKGIFKFEPMKKVNREILKKLGLCSMELIRNLKLDFNGYKVQEDIRQGLYEFGIFSTFLGGEEIPSWCGYRNNEGSSLVSFVVPSLPNFGIRGLNVYSVYTLGRRNNYFLDSCPLFTKINNKTKDLKWIYTPMAKAIPKKVNEEELVWLSHWKFGNHLEIGDEVDVSVIATKGLEVKEFGIKLVWGAEEEGDCEEIKATHHHHHNNTREVIGGDLSSFKFMSTRAFLLCHNVFGLYQTYTEVGKSWFRELFGDHVTSEDFGEWLLLLKEDRCWVDG